MALNHKEIEELADHLLESDFKDKRKNKLAKTEYPVLSPSQLKRRTSREIPYSNLSINQRRIARLKNYEYEEREGE